MSLPDVCHNSEKHILDDKPAATIVYMGEGNPVPMCAECVTEWTALVIQIQMHRAVQQLKRINTDIRSKLMEGGSGSDVLPL